MAADTNQPQIILFRWRFVLDIDRDTHATSPVVGIVLLVAIAIILAVSVSTFALGIADETQEHHRS
ncbi:type IV pilin [Natrialbaceae archaeon A-chndr2]